MTPILGKGTNHKSPNENSTSSRERIGLGSPKSRTTTHLASYTEKSLLVLKNYVFMEKNGSKVPCVSRGQGDAFTNAAFDGVNLQLSPDIWEKTKSLSKRVEKPESPISKRKSKPKYWTPNGGGIKPYNSADAQKKLIVPIEECIIDVKAVKPKVDTWFKRRSKEPSTPQETQRQTTSSKNTVMTQKIYPLKQPKEGTKFTFNHGRLKNGENEGDKTVKNLTSFWNDHLMRHPFTISNTKLHQNEEGVRKVERRCQGSSAKSKSGLAVQGRPMSVGSEGVVQEHTLQPSKLLSDLKKLQSVEDVLAFAKRANTQKSKSGVTSPPNTANPQGRFVSSGIQKKATVTKELELLQQPVVLNQPTKGKAIAPGERTVGPRRQQRRQHPKFIVRLHPRWFFTLKVLALSFRPLVEAWKQRPTDQNSSAELPHTVPSHDPLKQAARTEQLTICSAEKLANFSNSIGIKATLTRGARRCSEKFRALKRLARQGVKGTIQALTDESGSQTPRGPFLRRTRSPYDRPIIELRGPMISSDHLPHIGEHLPPQKSPSIDETFLTHQCIKRASVEIMPKGVRLALFVEYQLLFSFVLVQSVLVLIVFLIKWLQEYTV